MKLEIWKNKMNSLETFNHLVGPVERFDDLIGHCITHIEKRHDELKLYLSDNVYVHMYHQQDCCESVYIEDICGDLDDLIGSPLLEAEEITNRDDGPLDSSDESYTWTFYKFGTNNGSVTIRWYGCSNGYYSEYVDVKVVDESKDKFVQYE